jgi:hypothetical protein
LVFYLLQHLTADDASLLACVMWSIWKQRNNFYIRSFLSLYKYKKIISLLTFYSIKQGKKSFRLSFFSLI